MNERMPMSRIGAVALDRKVSAEEQQLRHELAAVFRIAHHLGWNVDTLNHISLRIPGTDTFLMNPQGLGWDEITASSLSTLDHKWNVLSHSRHQAAAGRLQLPQRHPDGAARRQLRDARARNRQHRARLDRRGRAAGDRRRRAAAGSTRRSATTASRAWRRTRTRCRACSPTSARQARADHAQPRHAQHRRDARRGVRLHARADRRLRAADEDHGDRQEAPRRSRRSCRPTPSSR